MQLPASSAHRLIKQPTCLAWNAHTLLCKKTINATPEACPSLTIGRPLLEVPPDPGDSLKLSAAHVHAVQQEMKIVRQAQRQQVQQASHPGPESLRPKLRDNRLVALRFHALL